MARRKIYVPQTDVTYDSISLASKALNVDASNIRKVLSGQRYQAGGYNFIDATNLSSRQIKSRAHKIFEDINSSGNKLKSLARSRGEDVSTYKQRQELWTLVQSANKVLRLLEKNRVTEFSEPAMTLLNVVRDRPQFGLTDYNTVALTQAKIDKLSPSDINLFTGFLTTTLQDKRFNLNSANQYADAVGRVHFDENADWAKVYRKYIPLMRDLLNNAEQYGFTSDELYIKMRDVWSDQTKTTVRQKQAYLKRFLETVSKYESIYDNLELLSYKLANMQNSIDSDAYDYVSAVTSLASVEKRKRDQNSSKGYYEGLLDAIHNNLKKNLTSNNNSLTLDDLLEDIDNPMSLNKLKNLKKNLPLTKWAILGWK